MTYSDTHDWVNSWNHFNEIYLRYEYYFCYYVVQVYVNSYLHFLSSVPMAVWPASLAFMVLLQGKTTGE